MNVRTRALKLPHLRMKDSLLKAEPDLARLVGEEPEAYASAGGADGGRAADATPRAPPPPTRDLLSASPYEEELSEAEELRLELELVKRERSGLMDALAALKADEARGGSHMQALDLRRLRHELRLKQDRLNELHSDATRLDAELERLATTSRDCAALLPGDAAGAAVRTKALEAELAAVDRDLADADAQHRLYTLLGNRTRREHMAMDAQVRAARAAADAYAEDRAALTAHVHAAAAAREDAERDLAVCRRQVAGVRGDWQRKLHDRRKEVHDLERRQKREAEAEERKRARKAEHEAAARERAAQSCAQEAAHEQHLQALAPKLESMEAAWAQLHTLTGADTPQEIIAFLEGLRAKEAAMRGLVATAEAREAAAKDDTAALQAARSSLLETPRHTPAPNLPNLKPRPGAAPAGSTPAEAEQEALRGSKYSDGLASHRDAPAGDAAAEDAPAAQAAGAGTRDTDASQPPEAALHAAIEGADARRAAAEKHFAQLRSVCIGAQQGLHSVVERLDIASIAATDAAAAAAAAAATAAEGARDPDFFPDLVVLLKGVAERLDRLIALEGAAPPLPEAPAGPESSDGLDVPSTPRNVELAAMKGMRRRSWTGPAWLNAITEHGHVVPEASVVVDSRKLARTASSAPSVDLRRLLGYAGEDLLGSKAESRPVSAEDEANEDGEWDGVVDREYIKHRTAKLLAAKRSADAKGAAAKAAA
ncbi:hypothetical protein WJX81_007569 [Elliptochloris bilobata]|uniref:Uncharacterized protein n=1 Tax=Elliptochloris bilobata TaxID=381761 RepID=A0AAW1RKF9_9CHLO